MLPSIAQSPTGAPYKIGTANESVAVAQGLPSNRFADGNDHSLMPDDSQCCGICAHRHDRSQEGMVGHGMMSVMRVDLM